MAPVFADVETEIVDLVARIISGNRDAEDELVKRYNRGVRFIAGQTVIGRAAIEDVCQETFKIVIERIRSGELRNPERLSGFVTAVARNTGRQHNRAGRRTRSIDDFEDAEQIPDPAPNPLDQVLQRELSASIRQVISELRVDRDRKLLSRYFIEEQDKDTICRDLSLTRKQFNYVIYRSLSRFKDLLMSKAEGPWTRDRKMRDRKMRDRKMHDE